jgi:hypothetical protein
MYRRFLPGIPASGTITLYKPELVTSDQILRVTDAESARWRERLPDRQSSAIRALLIALDVIGSAKRSPSACPSKLPKDCTARNACFGRLECIFHGDGGFSGADLDAVGPAA